MLKSYFKIGWRNLRRNKGYSIINIGGLAIGLTCFIIVMLYVQHEFSYDRFFAKSDHIYRVYQKQTGNVFLGTDYFGVTPVQLATVLKDEFPEISKATSVHEENVLLGTGDQHFWERGFSGGPDFFEIFPFVFTAGNPKTALKDPNSIVLTKSLGDRIFGAKEAIGQTIKYQDGQLFTVTGIVEDPPTNSSFQFSFISNIYSFDWYANEAKRPTWHNNNVHTFFLLNEKADPVALQSKFAAMIKKYQDPASYEKYPFKDEYFIQPLPSLHLSTPVNFDIGLKGNRQYVYIFPAVALIVLLLACVNYMNLAIARSIKRAREVGMRKAVGALRTQILGQFLGESVLIAFLSLLLAIGLAYLLLPAFGRIVARPISLNFFDNVWLLPALMILVVLVGLSSGSYPSFVIASLRPIQVLKGKMDGKLSSFRLQRWLIVGQYAVSIILIVSSVVIYRQLQFIANKELGYDRTDIVTIQLRDHSLMEKYDVLANDWKKQTAIVDITSSNELPTNISSSTTIRDEDSSSKEDDLAIYEWNVNYDFEKVFGLQLIAGRMFSTAFNQDLSESLILNETAAKALGWAPREAIGKQFVHDGMKTVIGVVQDFHMHSMHLAIQPLLIKMNKRWANYISVKVQPGKSKDAISFLESSLKKYSPFPFEYQFLDDHFKQLYSSDAKLGEIFGLFTMVSVLLASLGLFGLAAFSAGQRTKEIGIRKVLGASSQNIVTLLTKDFLGLVIGAFLLSIPIAWYTMHIWLEAFAYRIDISWWIFAGAGGTALLIANLAIGYQSIKASLADPVESLKCE